VPEPHPIVMPDPPLSDGIVSLRMFVPSDAPIVHANLDDPGVRAYMSIPLDQTLEGSTRFILSREDAMRSGTSATFAVTDAATGELLGSIGVERSADDPAIGDIGYWLFATHRGRGVMTRAVRLITPWAFEALGLARLQITVHLDNVASQRVAEKSGYLREGVLRSLIEQHGRRVDLIMFARLVTDPAPPAEGSAS